MLPPDKSARNSYVSMGLNARSTGGTLVECARRDAIGLAEREMHLRRSRQVPRRAKRGALQSKDASGCARVPSDDNLNRMQHLRLLRLKQGSGKLLTF